MATKKDITGAVPASYSDDFTKRSKDLWKHADFQNQLVKTIKGSTEIQNEIKRLVWETVLSKMFWIIVGAVGSLLVVLSHAYLGGFVSKIGEKTAESFISPS